MVDGCGRLRTVGCVARSPRIDYPGAVHHVMNRGAAGQPILGADDDKSLFLELMSREAVARQWSCHAYCLMTNHFHLIVQTSRGDLAAGMHRVGTCFANQYNRAYEARGHVFHGRFQSIPVEDDEYAVELARYLAMNPVEAGLCAAPEEWPWSSYAVTIKEGGFRPGFGDDWMLGLVATRRNVAIAGLRALMGPGTVKNL